VAAYRAVVEDVDRGDGGAGDVTLEAGADDLDLGELGHRAGSAAVSCRR
jgi:hypothetical protein